jgi:putative salt-induced outer membrane protein
MIKTLSTPSLTFLIASALSTAAEESPWEFTSAAGLSFSDGNSDSLAYSLQFLGSYLKDGNEAYFGMDYFQAEDNGIENTDNLKLFGQFNDDISDRWYVGGHGSYYHDEIADTDYRVDAGVLLGFRAINRENTKLSFEAGPGYAWEEQGGSRSEFATIRLAQRFEHHFSKTSKVWQSLSWTPRADDPDDALAEFEAGVETRITRQWSLRSYLRYRFDDTPAAGRSRYDTALMLGLSYNLNGLPDPEEGGSSRRSLMPDDLPEDEKKDGWISIAALGFSLNQGNSDRFGINLDWNSLYRNGDDEFIIDLGYNYSEDSGATSTDRVTSLVQYNWFFDGPVYLGTSIAFLRDQPAAIDYRVAPAVIVGYSLIKSDATSLAFEAGPSYTFEESGGINSSYISMIAAERFSHKFNERFTFNQALVYTSELADFENFTLVASAELDTKLVGRLIWRLGLDYTYENIPAAGLQHHDTLVSSSLALKF